MTKERIILFVLAAITFTNILDFMVLMPLAPQLKRAFEMDPQEWSLAVSSYSFAAFISGIFSIFFIDRFDRKKFLIFIYAGFIIGTFFCGMAESYNMLVLSRIVTGVFGGIIGGIVLAIVGDIIPPERRGAAMGTIMAGFSAAAALGVPFGLYFGAKFSWHIPFLSIAGFGVLLMALVWYFIPSLNSHISKEAGIKTFQPIMSILRDKNQVVALLFMTLLVFAQFLIIPFLSPYMVKNVGFEEIQLTYIYFAGGVLTIFSSPIFGKLADRFGQFKIFYLLLFLSLIPVFLITNMPRLSILLALVPTSMFFIFAGGRMVPATAIVLGTARPESRGAFMSVRSSLQHIGAGMAAFTSGLIMSEDATGHYLYYEWVGYLSMGCGLLSILLVRRVRMRY